MQDPAFDDDRVEVMARAREAGIEALVVIASNPEDAARAREVAESDPPAPGRAWTAGLHPHEASRWGAAVRRAVEARLEEGAIAVGEIGLDRHYRNSTMDEQARAFADQLALAAERDLPVVVHSREAEAETMAALEESGLAPERVVLHCFAGSRGMLEEAVARGYFVSFSGLVTFRRFPGAELVPLVPGEQLLVESDAPYLAPVPHRGKRNEPAFVADTVRALAGFRGEMPDAVGARTHANARRFYRLDAGDGGPRPPGSLA